MASSSRPAPARSRPDDEPGARPRRTAARAGRPHPGRKPDVGCDRRADGSRRGAVPGGQPRAGADGAARRDRLHRARLRLDHARLLDHPGVLRARLQDPVGAEGQLADRPDGASRSTRHPTTSASPTTCSTTRTAAACSTRSASCGGAFGDEVAIVGKTMGPWSLGYHCFGVERFLLMSLDDPAMTRACLERLKEVTVAFGLAQIEAGADALTLPDHATGDLVSGEYYHRYLLDLHVEFAERLPASHHPPHLRPDGRPHGRYRQDRDGGLPLRLEERPGRVDGRRATAASASSATSTTPRPCSRAAQPRCGPR